MKNVNRISIDRSSVDSKVVDKVISEYTGSLQATYKLYATRIEDLINSFLRSEGLRPHSIMSREKSANGLREKLTRDGKSYDEPLKDITDLAGVRIITYFPKDVDRIAVLLEKEFKVDRENSIDKRVTADPAIFGYASMHLVVELSPERLRLKEYAVFTGLKCEIQIRTILQHAWAEIEHDIVYKTTQDIPPALRRKFASLAGLLEVADREFEMIRQEEAVIREQTRVSITNENLQVPIDMESLKVYLEKYQDEKDISAVRLSILVSFLSFAGLTTIEQLHDIISTTTRDETEKLIKTAKIDCSPERARKCLIRYYLIIGRQKGYSEELLGDKSHCPMLIHGIRTSVRSTGKALSRERLKVSKVSKRK